MSHASPATHRSAAERADLASLIGAKLGNYRLERLIGRGRMGVVYLANDEALLRPTAIKILSWSFAEPPGQDRVQWFLAEARLVARINDPRVVQIYGAARHGDWCYIAMEYVPGQSAEAIVASGGPMPPARATDVLLQAASALHAAHRSGVVHRDVKPANLLVGVGGATKLGDFGMALGAADATAGSTRLRVGTPYYLAPEIWRGEAASASSDLYSLGATYFQLLTGRPPFPGADVTEVEAGHLGAPVPDPREIVTSVPASCAALAMRMLAKLPLERPASAKALLLDARRALQDLASPVESPTISAQTPGHGAAAMTPMTRDKGADGMPDLALISKLPDVKSAVLGDLAGAFLDSVNEPDGETIAAVMGFVSSTMAEAGEHLGLGALRRISLSGEASACVVVVQEGSVMTATVEPSRALAAVEKLLDTSLQARD